MWMVEESVGAVMVSNCIVGGVFCHYQSIVTVRYFITNYNSMTTTSKKNGLK